MLLIDTQLIYFAALQGIYFLYCYVVVGHLILSLSNLFYYGPSLAYPLCSSYLDVFDQDQDTPTFALMCLNQLDLAIPCRILYFGSTSSQTSLKFLQCETLEVKQDKITSSSSQNIAPMGSLHLLGKTCKLDSNVVRC